MRVAACASNWLESEPIAVTTMTGNTTTGLTNSSLTGNTGLLTSTYYYPYYSPYFYTTIQPIRLKLSEVEYLRKQAKNDKKLKEILQKFTGVIQITVDFD